MNGTAQRLALITGGCRRIGAAIAARLAADGWALALHASENCVPEPALADAIAAHGTRWSCFAADLSDPVEVEALVPRVRDHFGRVPDLLVNNAARFAFDTPDDAGMAEMLAHHAVNVAAPAILSRAVAAGAGADAPRVIVNLLDQRIAAPNGDQLSYTLSKLALAELTGIHARHFAPHVRVVGVAPGLTLPTADYTSAQMARLAEAMPLHRLPAPAEIADAVAWAAGAGAVTGQVIYVDAGAHLCRFERDFLFLRR